jgi:two-component system, OmpR family, sensor kinase
MRNLTFKVRLALWHAVAVAVVLAVAAASADWGLSRAVHGQVDSALLELAQSEAAAAQAERTNPPRVHEVAPGTSGPSFIRLDKFVQITDAEGRVVSKSATLGESSLPLSQALVAGLREGEIAVETRNDVGGEPVRLLSLPVKLHGRRYIIQVAASLDDAYAVLREARLLFLGMALAILAAVVATGALLAQKILRPIDRIVTRARLIGESRLAERLPHPGGRDEIGRLVETLNEMLARLERSFEAQRRFTSDASHELRSPLSRLRAELEVTLRRRRESSEYEEALRSSLDEVERLSRLTEDLLMLARLDADGTVEMPTEPVPLLPILEEALQRVGAIARSRDVTVLLEPGPAVSVRVSAGATSLVVSNVLDNAVKFSPPGSRVTVGVAADREAAVVAVTDNGPGISEDEIPQIFERFYRGQASRSAGAPGVGLGLAICRSVLAGWGGAITVTSDGGLGATVSVRLPLAT